jgi:hypothetical protein
MTPMQWEDSGLAGALDALRQDEGRIETPPHVEAAVLAAWDRDHAPRVDARPGRLWRRAAAVAAAVTIAVGLVQLGRELRQVAQTSRWVEGRSTLLLVGEPILQGEPVRVVRMRVPASALTGLGVRSTTGNPAGHVDVDVIVGEDGIARAIRVGM